MKKISIKVMDTGDESVGIWSGEIFTLTFPEDTADVAEDKENRDFIRRELIALGKEFSAGHVWAAFDDECPDCLEVWDGKKCKNPKCIRNGTEEDKAWM